MERKEIPELMDLSQTLLGQWVRYRQFFLKGISGERPTPEEEQDFLQTASSIAQNVRKIAQRLDDKKYPFRQKEISDQLKGAISISHFAQLPEADQKKFYAEWHVSLIYLSRTVGALKFLSEGYIPVEKVAGKKGGKQSSGGKSGGLMIVVVLLIVVALGGGFAALKFLGVF